MKKPDAFVSSLSRARGLGAAHHGVSHWWLQRLTAVALIPLSLWFIASLLAALLSQDMGIMVRWLSSPAHALGMVLFLLAMFVHGKLGLQVIIEDYVHAPASKYTLLIGMTFLCYGALALGILSVLKLHLLLPA